MEGNKILENNESVEVQKVGFPGPHKKNNGLKKTIFLIIIFLILVAGGGYSYFKFVSNETNFTINGNITPTVSLSPTEAPSPTSSLTKEKNKLTVQILNGTGITGEAAKLEDLLEGLGYTEIEIGNAEKTGYVTTEVYLSEMVSISDREELKTELAKIYQEVKVTEVASPTFDIRIIIGYKKGVNVAPTLTSSLTPTKATTTVSVTVTVSPTSSQ